MARALYVGRRWFFNSSDQGSVREGLDHFSNSLTVKHGISVPLTGLAARNVLPVFSPGEDKSVAIPFVTIAPRGLIVS